MNVIGERVQRERRAQGLTQLQLAREMGVSQGHISNIERGKIDGSGSLKRICTRLGIDYVQLFSLSIGLSTEVQLAIQDDPRLRRDDADLLLQMYALMLKRGPFGSDYAPKDGG